MERAAALSDITNASSVKRRIRGHNIEKIFTNPMCVEKNSVAAKNRKPSSMPSDINSTMYKKCRVRGPNIEKMYTNAMQSNDSDVGIDDVYHDDLDGVILNQNLWRGYMDLGPPLKLCNKYGATMWNEERNNKSCPHKEPAFSMCCRNDQIHLPKERPPPDSLASLLLGGEKSRHFKQYIRVYNYIFQFTSTGSKIDNSINRGGASDNVDPDIVEELLSILDKNNELVKTFHMAQNRFENEELDAFKLVLILSQSSSGRPNHITPSDEVAAFIVSDDMDTGDFRDTVVNSKQEGLKMIYETDPHFMQLQYPLLFPWGTEGYRIRLTPHLAGRLWQRKGDYDPIHVGKAVILPASFTGSRRYMSQYFKDSLVVCRVIGHPSLFLTMTCNSKWPEIQKMLKLLPNVDPIDAPNIVFHVLNFKLDQLLDLIKKKNYFGKCIGVMHVIEFQKRGLPHVHILIWLSPESRPNSIEKVDQLVSAEILDTNSDLIAYEAVKNYMMHGPCGKDLYTSPCMVKGKCIRHFPKRFNGNTYFDDCGFPVYRRRNTGRVINKKGINLDNQYVVPYNRDLILRFQCHINLEICNSSRSLKYLFNYCLKGHDTTTMLLKNKSNKSGNEQNARSVKNLDEVMNFLDGRYVCASEASWMIFGFDIHHRSPSVERLPIHFPGQKYLNFQSSADLENVCNNATSKKSKLEAWFVANSEFPQARNFTYSDFPTHFTWIKKTAKWKLRQRGDVVGRLAEVHAATGDLLYLRMLLLRCKGALSFIQLKTIDGTTYDTFKEACGALVPLNNDKQWHDALEENAFSAMPTQIRAMFVNILENCSVSDPLALWEKHWPAFSNDVLYMRRKISDNIHLTLSKYEIQNYALAEIEKLLNDVGKSLRDFHMMPFLDEQFFHTFVNRLIVEETSYNKEELRLNHEKAHKNLNSRKLDVYNAVIDNILHVLPKAGRAEIVNASFNKSRLWKSCKVFLLSQNMILHSGNSEARKKVIADFSKWQLEIGDGKVECIDTHRADFETEFVVPDDYFVKSPLKSPIKTLIDIIYPDFQNNMHSQEYLRSRSILTPKNVVVDDINAQILERVPGNVHTYLIQDSTEDRGVDDNDFDSLFPVEYLNSINMPCMPKHELKLKVGAVVMLMRNLNHIMGLCNGTRMIFTGCKKIV
ncbi:uncharacterized protein LOC141719593 [Apium graveolens]|uniref:uncharacterized protein LOC141719593 n=1 Tax=Apium graveolens TaxID=4045 RepID=UPI003D7AEADB